MTTPPPRATPATIVEQGYQTWLWVDERVAAFPVSARRQLGHRAIDAALDALTATVQASYLPRGDERIARLREANRALSVLRILLRGARDRRHLSIAQHEHAMRRVDDGGRQVGGWLRADQGKAAP